MESVKTALTGMLGVQPIKPDHLSFQCGDRIGVSDKIPIKKDLCVGYESAEGRILNYFSRDRRRIYSGIPGDGLILVMLHSNFGTGPWD